MPRGMYKYFIIMLILMYKVWFLLSINYQYMYFFPFVHFYFTNKLIFNTHIEFINSYWIHIMVYLNIVTIFNKIFKIISYI